jgi:hypothetical protein
MISTPNLNIWFIAQLVEDRQQLLINGSSFYSISITLRSTVVPLHEISTKDQLHLSLTAYLT